MMRKIFLFLLLSTMVLRSIAQEYIHGTVTSKGGKPITGAAVTVLQSNDSIAGIRSETDKNGYYKITMNKVVTHLSVSKQGFLTEIAGVSSTDTVLNIIMTLVKSLDEVVITERRKLIEEKADRTVFNLEKSVVAQGGDALEAIKKMPGVQVQQQQINISGLGGVSIMVNGRMQHLSGDELIQFLRSIPANNLSKIELITSPGAKYDAAGNSGIINLVTRKNLKEGFSGSIAGRYHRNTFNSASGSTSLQYRKGKFNFYTNDNTDDNNLLYTNRVDFKYNDERWNRTVLTDYNSKNTRIQAGVDYELRKDMTLGAVYTQGFGGNDGKDHVQARQFRAPIQPDSVIRSESATRERFRHKRTANVNYEWRIDTTGKKLNISTDYFSQEVWKERNFNISNYQASGIEVSETKLKIFESPAIDIRSANADLELPYTVLDIQMGGKMSFTNNKAGFIFQRLLPNGFTTDSSKSNRFHYSEQIQAGYINMKKKIEKVEIVAGIRTERTLARGMTPDGTTNFNRDYTQLFPSFSTSYKLNEHHNFVFSYMRRIERPGYSQLNPFKMYFTENTYQQGTPGLQPALSNSFRISWYMNAKYHLRLRVNQVNNYFDRIYFTDTVADATVVTRMNLGSAWMYVANFSFSEDPADWWNLNGEVSATYNRFLLGAYGRANTYEGWSGWMELNNTFYLNKKKTLIAELNGYYYSPRQKDYKLWRSMRNINGGFKALLLNKTLMAGIVFDDPFATSAWHQTNKETGTTEYSYDDERSVGVSMSYRFGNKNLKGRRDKSEAIEEIQRAR